MLLCVSILFSGCNPGIVDTEKPAPASTQVNYPDAPEPQGPVIKGTISGLPEGTLATISARFISSTSGGYIGDRTNGPWEMVVLYDENTQRKVIAQAEGYSAQPVEYLIYFKEGKAFLIKDGIQTDQEATYLDFEFFPLLPTRMP
jgi:hypothetical protein